MATPVQIITLYVCPTLGCLVSYAMCTAPVNDLRRALLRKSLGSLNPFPWVMMTGNCAGWVIYGYYISDLFIVAANLPGFILSLWLNMGAAKLQYVEFSKEKPQERSSIEDSVDGEQGGHLSDVTNEKNLVMLPQERAFLGIVIVWFTILIWVSWFYPV